VSAPRINIVDSAKHSVKLNVLVASDTRDHWRANIHPIRPDLLVTPLLYNVFHVYSWFSGAKAR